MSKHKPYRTLASHAFALNPQANIRRSKFNRSSTLTTTINTDALYPIYRDEILPGDTVSCTPTYFARLTTPLVPFMDELYFDTQTYFVPNRLVWDNWQKFCGEQRNPDDHTDYLTPVIAQQGPYQPQSIFDYMGYPTLINNLQPHVAFYLRAYNLIWNEWYRDQNVMDRAVEYKGDGPDPSSNYILLGRTKRKDYFTSALPWPQKGAGVEIPLGATAPVYGNGKSLGFWAGTYFDDGNPIGFGAYNAASEEGRYNTGAFYKNAGQIRQAGNAPTADASLGIVPKGRLYPSDGLHAPSGLYADLSTASAYTINSLRQAFQIQKYLERSARGGTRYTEILYAHYGVISPDARLQRPELLHVTTQRIHVNPVPQTSSSDNITPQGHLSGFALTAKTHRGFVKSFTEHGTLLILASVRSALTYQQGLHRQDTRRTRLDYHWPAFNHLGEQAILRQELVATGSPSDLEVFGYIPRFDEYRYKPSQITGLMRSNAPATLHYWHLAQQLSPDIKLNAQFIYSNTPIDRVVQVPSQPKFYLNCYWEYHHTRAMPVHGVPGLVDHF